MCSRCSCTYTHTQNICSDFPPIIVSPVSIWQFCSYVTFLMCINVYSIHDILNEKKNVWKYCKIGAHKWVFNIHNNCVSRRYIHNVRVRNENPNEMRVFYTGIHIIYMCYRNARVLFIFSSFVCLIQFYFTLFFVFAIR